MVYKKHLQGKGLVLSSLCRQFLNDPYIYCTIPLLHKTEIADFYGLKTRVVCVESAGNNEDRISHDQAPKYHEEALPICSCLTLLFVLSIFRLNHA